MHAVVVLALPAVEAFDLAIVLSHRIWFSLTESGPTRWSVSLNLVRRPDDLAAVSPNLVCDRRLSH